MFVSLPWNARHAIAWQLVALLTAAACGSSSEPACDVQRVFSSSGCTGCHAAPSPAAGLDLSRDPSVLGQSLVDAPSSACSGRRLIDTRAPEASVLLSAVDHARRQVDGSCALAMPPRETGDGLPPEGLACLTSWVTELTQGKQVEAFEPASIETALAKVKLLAHGGAATQSELATVTAEPARLRELLDGWTRAPEFTPKLRSFLGTALQQDSIGAMKESLGFPTAHFEPSDALRGALARSFVDTAEEIVTTGAPFTQVVTTHRRSLSTAELVLLAYADQTSSEIEGTTYKVRIVGPAKQNNVPATLTRNGDVWELGGAAAPGQTCRFEPPDSGEIPDPQVMSSSKFLAMLFGRVQCRGQGDLRFTGPVAPRDHVDRRHVSLERTGGTRLAFTDLVGLRALADGAVLRLRVPRPGFFTTSAFLDNWPTNVDNAFRVTLNQTLMVALGATYSMGDPTPNAETGIDQAHADPSTPCYQCHRLMDPMRPFFANGMDTSYRAASGTSPATFAFQGVSRTGSSADDLAAALVEHPRFATAWVLRICSWANSRACSEIEPGVVELAASFRAGGWDLRKLIVDTLSSPLVTGLSGTALSERPDASIARRRHLCAALRVRLGELVDTSGVCGAGRSALSRGIPDDAFARNQPAFVQTSAPGTFHAAGLDRLCEALAPAAVTSLFPTSDAAGSTKKLVERLMGLPPGHPRHDRAIAALTAHQASVASAGGTADQAMQSAFVVACTSPDVSGVGL